MLKIITDAAMLKYSPIMEIYCESNRKQAELSMHNLTFNEALFDVENQFYQYLKYDFLNTEDAFVAIWEENGQWVSALRMEPYKDGLLLSGLETNPVYRGNGFASALMRHALEYIAGAQTIYSHVKKQNLASLTVHEKCGFQIIQDHSTYIDGSTDRDCFTLCKMRLK